MNKETILIVEDEALIADHLALCLEDLGYQITGICDSAEQALLSLSENLPDLVLLDIKIDGALDGVDLAQEIYRRFKIPFIFITSNTDKRTLERVKISEPAGFVVKPYTSEDLEVNLGIALYRHRQKTEMKASGSPENPEAGSEPQQPAPEMQDGFFVKEKHALIRIRYTEILYAEAMDNYTRLHLKTGKHVLSQTLKNVEEKLKEHGFLRIHRSFLVNLLHIDQIFPRHVLINGKEIPMSEGQRQRLLEMVALF